MDPAFTALILGEARRTCAPQIGIWAPFALSSPCQGGLQLELCTARGKRRPCARPQGERQAPTSLLLRAGPSRLGTNLLGQK